MCLKGAVGSMKNRTRDERDQPLGAPSDWTPFFTLNLLPPMAGTGWEVRACSD